MPFLLPALVALASDGAILYLNRLGNLLSSNSSDNNNSFGVSDVDDDVHLLVDANPEEASEVYFWVGYLQPLAILRIVLLLLPLLFHSYTGTALRFPRLYQFLYVGTLILVLVHMLGLLFMNPQSLESILPLEVASSSTRGGGGDHDSAAATPLATETPAAVEPWSSPDATDDVGTDDDYEDGHYFHHHHRLLLQHLHALRRVWWMLVFTVLSNACHLILLQHVKSTAPDQWLDQKQPQSVYFAIRSSRQHYEDDDEETEPALVNAVNDFLVDVQVRLRRTKQEWTKRLDDFTRRVHERSGVARSSSVVASDGTTPPPPSPGGHLLGSRSLNNNTTPFRVLLQLFADQDVLQNGKLSAAFDSDDGQSMTFLVPQLLSFLLHGATTQSQALEEWILAKCRENVQFAHCCYWFLRAWCLEVPGSSGVDMLVSPSISRQNSESQLAALEAAAASHHHRKTSSSGSGSNSGLLLALQQPSPLPYLDQPAAETTLEGGPVVFSGGGGLSSPHPLTPQQPPASSLTTVTSAATSLCLPDAANQQQQPPSISTRGVSVDKFLPQERAMIERLMLRVKECGEESARVLEWGRQSALPLPPVPLTTPTKSPASASISSSMSPSKLMQVVERGAVPIDPISGRPSQRHLDCMAASQKYGFRPLLATTPNNGKVSPDNHNQLSSTEQFDKTPQFLDALIYIAELLHSNVPREARKDELQNLLRQLECELLPDNCVYVPSRRSHGAFPGRVWRIAASECIPISTKERVPCILALEVVQLTTEQDDESGVLDNNSSGMIQGGESYQHQRSSLSATPSDQQQQASWASLLDRFALSSSSRIGTPPSQGEGSRMASQQRSGFLSSDVSSPGSLRRMLSTGSASDHDEATLSPRPPLTPTTPGGGLGRKTSGGGGNNFNGDHHHALSEAELVDKWKNRSRNPMRLVPLIDKVGASVKGTMDRVKSTILQERFLHDAARDRAVSEELKSLTQHNANDDDLGGDDQEALEGSRDEETVGHVEIGRSGGPPPPPNRQSQHQQQQQPPPPPPPAPMGQWASPATGQMTARKTTTKATPTAVASPNLRRRSDNVVGSSSNNNIGNNRPPRPGAAASSKGGGIALPYGTGDDHDDKAKNKDVSSDSRKMPSSPATTIASGSTSSVAVATSSGSKPPPVVFRESWHVKQERVRQASAYGSHPGWRLQPILIKANDDLRQEELCSQLIYRMAAILAREKVPVWLCPYEIIALTDRGGMIEAIPDTISIDSLKKNDPNFTNLRDFFRTHYGPDGTPELAAAKANFVESLAAYSMVCFLLQIKDRHNGNILLDSEGHVIHIDFGFFFLSSPGKNAGFESAPFKLTRDMVQVMDGPHSHLYGVFCDLCIRSFLALRKHCMEIILLVEMLVSDGSNKELGCFCGRPQVAVDQLRARFRLDLNDRACRDYIQSLIDASMENWRTDWYDRYQRYFVGVL